MAGYTLGARTSPTRRRWPRCCGRSTAARSRRSRACRATATPAASAWSRPATSLVAADGAHLLPDRGAARPDPGDDRPYVIRAMGEQAARRYFLTAERFSAAEAHAHRLRARGRAPPTRSTPRSTSSSRALVANGPTARAGLQAAGAGRRRPRRSTPRCAPRPRARIADIRASDEGREGVQSFLGKRKPAWLLSDLSACDRHARHHAAARASPRRSAGPAACASTRCCSSPGWPATSAGSTCRPGLQLLQHPVDARRQRLHAVRRILRRQDPRPRHALGHGPHADPHPGRRGARGRACSAPTRRPGRLVAALLGGTLAATSHVAKATTRAAVNTSPEPFSNIALSLGVPRCGRWWLAVGADPRVRADRARAARFCRLLAIARC